MVVRSRGLRERSLTANGRQSARGLEARSTCSKAQRRMSLAGSTELSVLLLSDSESQKALRPSESVLLSKSESLNPVSTPPRRAAPRGVSQRTRRVDRRLGPPTSATSEGAAAPSSAASDFPAVVGDAWEALRACAQGARAGAGVPTPGPGERGRARSSVQARGSLPAQALERAPAIRGVRAWPWDAGEPQVRSGRPVAGEARTEVMHGPDTPNPQGRWGATAWSRTRRDGPRPSRAPVSARGAPSSRRARRARTSSTAARRRPRGARSKGA